MAILKHIAVKNANYGEAQRYLIFKYDEKTGKRSSVSLRLFEKESSKMLCFKHF